MGRNAAELIEAAKGTGTYDDYVGDGATVPWQVGVPQWGMLLLAYKSYLDRRWPEAFKLHDWCYTPFGKLIEVTREEADDALHEMIAVDSPVDAAIVYAAVRAGGGLYFGSSTTGWYPRNMLVPRLSIQGDNMATYKIVMLFQQLAEAGASDASIGYVGRARIAGWSESVYFVGDFAAMDTWLKTGVPNAELPGLLPARAGLLHKNGTLVGYRVYDVGGGRAQSFGAAYPGNHAWVSNDIPQMALLCSGGNVEAGTSRKWTIRGIPDNKVTHGAFSPTSAYAGAVKKYFQALGSFSFRATSTASTTKQIFSVNPGGLVTLTSANEFTIGSQVIIQGARNLNGVACGGKYLITSVGELNSQFTVADWTHGATTGGKVFVQNFAYHTLTPSLSKAVRIVTRKVGRPFESYSGRSSRKNCKG